MNKYCIKFLLFSFVTFLFTNAFAQKDVLVSVNEFDSYGWEKSHTNLHTGSAETAVFNTPLILINCNSLLVPPYSLKAGLHTGAVYISLPYNNTDPLLPGSPADNTIGKVRLRNSGFNFNLNDIAIMKYSTFTISPVAPSTSPATPVATRLILQIDKEGDGTADGSIIFEPSGQPHIITPRSPFYPKKVEFNKWQEWDVVNGFWIAMPATLYPPKANFTLEEFSAYYGKKAKIISTDPNHSANDGGGVRFTVPGLEGYYDYKGYIDAFKIQRKPVLVVNTSGKTGKKTSHLQYQKYMMYDFGCL